MNQRAHVVIAALLWLCLSGPAQAQGNYQDMWWQPAESGWGLMVVQQQDIISSVLFHYDDERKPRWYLLSNAPRGADERFSGTLFETRGPPLFSAFDPQAVDVRAVGTMTLHFTAANAATVEYSIDGESSSREIERITFSTIDGTGEYFGSHSAFVQCPSNPQVGNYIFPSSISVVQGNVVQVITSNSLLNSGTVSCTWNIALEQQGSAARGSGTWICVNQQGNLVQTATVEVEELRFVGKSLLINFQAVTRYSGALTDCNERGLISGVRF